MNDILKARELRSNHIDIISKKHFDKSIVILKANTPGEDKNTNNSKILIKTIDKLLSSILKDNIINKEKIDSPDGDYFLFVVEYDRFDLKRLTHFIETFHPLGKFVDIDCYVNQLAISRTALDLSKRKCFICEKEAIICTRNQTHSIKDILNAIDKAVKNYLVKSISKLTSNAIIHELELYPKFGLVSKVDSGCHTDMNYDTFIKSELSLSNGISNYLKQGLIDINPTKLKEIGLSTEKEMFKATNEVNTHKGLVFLIGLFLPSVINTIINNEDVLYLRSKIIYIAESVIGNYYENLEETHYKSNSDIVFKKHNIKGIREEAINGLPSLFNKGEYSSSLDTLMHFMSVLDDTTIIHKTSLETLINVKKEAKSILNNGGYKNNIIEVNKLSDDYKQKNISPGGSADMLVLSLIYDELKYLIK